MPPSKGMPTNLCLYLFSERFFHPIIEKFVESNFVNLQDLCSFHGSHEYIVPPVG